jgi:hypothetical protein
MRHIDEAMARIDAPGAQPRRVHADKGKGQEAVLF